MSTARRSLSTVAYACKCDTDAICFGDAPAKHRPGADRPLIERPNCEFAATQPHLLTRTANASHANALALAQAAAWTSHTVLDWAGRERPDLPQEPSTGGPPSATRLNLVVDATEALDYDRDVARALLGRAAALLRSRGERSLKAPPTPRPALAPWQAKHVVGHINENLGGSLRLGELASVADLGSSHFSCAFKGAFEQTPPAFIVLRRVERARQELLRGREPPSQIALSCGFADQAHLARIFRPKRDPRSD